MSEEKQIEEMAKDLKMVWECVRNEDKAGALYETFGWRKQSEGEWKSGKTPNGQWGYYCSICSASFVGVNAEWIAKEHDYCPKCGAKMKGGAGDNE